MFKILSVSTILLFFNSLTLAQSQSLTAPTNWERYTVTNDKFSVLMPELPAIIDDYVGANYTGTRYVAYNDSVVYVVFVAKSSEYQYPKNEATGIIFGKPIKQLDILFDGQEFRHFSSANAVIRTGKYNGKFYEISAFGANEENANVKTFLNSLQVGKNSTGKEIGLGARLENTDESLSQNLPKPEDAEKVKPSEKKKTEVATSVKVIVYPQPTYTKEARRKAIIGVVKLKVTLTSRGTVINPEVIEGLPFGLTENAIASARKIFFLPATRNGQKISVRKLVYFYFNLI